MLTMHINDVCELRLCRLLTMYDALTYIKSETRNKSDSVK